MLNTYPYKLPPPPDSKPCGMGEMTGRTSFIALLLLLLVGAGVALALGLLALPLGAQELPVFPGDPTGPEDLAFTALDASNYFTCGVTRAKDIRCWGDVRLAPIHAVGFKAVASGDAHACGIKLDGAAQCWGQNWRNRGNNQLDIPTNEDGTAISFAALDSNAAHTCGIREDNNQLVCWGFDDAGQSSGQSLLRCLLRLVRQDLRPGIRWLLPYLRRVAGRRHGRANQVLGP